ncbi:MAG TPA: hypothetical protein VMG62_01870 [Solirubrobacteraceae bacterium]|nr:hypothetical protein [Solirubrobacteraceae bacterium]
MTLLSMLTVLALAGAPAEAHASGGDTAATHAYLLASYALARASQATVGTAQAKVHSYARRLRRECPGVGAGAPQSEAEWPLTDEVAGALWSITYGVNSHAIASFARTVSGLHWSVSRITRAAHAYVTTLRGLASLPLPDVCGDVQAWRAGGFGPPPASTTSFDRHVAALEAHTIPAKLLGPHEGSADRALAQTVARLERSLLNIETVDGYDDWDEVLEAVSLPQ